MPEAVLVEVAAPNRAVTLKQQLIEFGRRAADLILQNGLLLREYRSGGYYTEDGHKTFDDAIEAMKDAGQLDYGARQARHFISIVDMCEALSIGPAEINKLGISKLREIASVKDTGQQLAMLGTADQMSVSEVQKEAKRLRDKAAGRETDPLDPITLLMTASQKQFYTECIERGRLIAGLGKDKVPDVAILVDVILADWSSGAADGPPTPEGK